jgi:hypothetical protein
LFSEATYQDLLANPGQFANQLRAVPDGKWVVSDEVQRLLARLNEVRKRRAPSPILKACGAGSAFIPKGLSSGQPMVSMPCLSIIFPGYWLKRGCNALIVFDDMAFF